MLHLQNLYNLNKHCSYLYEKTGIRSLFVVGGAVRDSVLGLVEDPYDVDITCAGDPKQIFANTDKTDVSAFMTEKFGTMTFIPKTTPFPTIDKLQYELTPFRTEGKYDDHRHPDEIQRNATLLEDSNRRDFTINCLYYTSVQTPPHNLPKELSILHVDQDEKINSLYEKQGFLLYPEYGILIVRKHDLIQQLFTQTGFQSDFFSALLDFTTTVVTSQEQVPDTFTLQGVVVDPHGGIADLQAGKLKAVGNPDTRFFEDGLRIMRALRLVNVLNERMCRRDATMARPTSCNDPITAHPATNITAHRIEKHAIGNIQEGHAYSMSLRLDFDTATRHSIKKNYYLLLSVAKERIKDEIVKVFSQGNPFGFIALLDEVNLLKDIFPALYRNKYVDQPVRYHPFDVYTHILLTLYHLQQINTNYLVRLGMLYHDVGKVEQYYMYQMGLDREEKRKMLGSWLNHVNCGVDFARRDFSALGFSTKEIEEICRYVSYHMKPGEILDSQPEKQIKKLRKLLSEVGYEKAQNILDITIGDRMGQFNPLQSSEIQDVYTLKKTLETLYNQEGQFTKKDLAISGSNLMETFGLIPGPQIGKLLDMAFKRVLHNQERNEKEKILTYLKGLLENTQEDESQNE